MSTKPGITTAPSASMRCVAAPETDPMAEIRPPSIAMSPTNGAPPVPSTTVPPEMTRSCGMGWLRLSVRGWMDGPDRREDIVDERSPSESGRFAIGVDRRTHHDEAFDAERRQRPEAADAVLGGPD